MRDDELKALAENRGVIGICFYPYFVKADGRASVDDVVTHIMYIKDLIGIEHVGLGPDFIDYAEDVIVEELKDSSLYPGFVYPEGLKNVTELPNLTLQLWKRGFSELEIRQVLGENFLRVFRKVWRE